MKNIRKFIMNALLLCGVSLLMRAISVSFGVYVSNRAGAEAMGLYTLLSSVWGFALTFATSGIHLATTRAVSEALGKGDTRNAKRVLLRCFVYAGIFSFTATLLLYCFAPYISTAFLDDQRCIRPLRILSISLMPISLSTVSSAYFTAVRRVWKNAVVSVTEQVVRISAVIFFLSRFTKYGIEFACIALALGGTIADISSFLLSFLAYFIDKKKNLIYSKKTQDKSFTTGKLLGIALPVAVSTYVRSGLVSVEHVLIPRGLKQSGDNKEDALASYGTLHGMVMPILLFPSALIGSFAGLLIPEMTECEVKGNNRQIRYISERVMELCLIFSIGIAGIMTFFSSGIGELIYPGKGTSPYLRSLAPLIPVMYLDSSVDAMLKGLGKQVYNMTVNILDSLLSILLVLILLPKYGIGGYILTVYITEIVNAAFSITGLINKSAMRPRLCKWLFKPLICIIGASVIARILFSCIKNVLSPLWLILVIRILLVGILYIAFLFWTKGIDKEDITWIKGIVQNGKINDTDGLPHSQQ